MIVTIVRSASFWSKVFHYLIWCPTFWEVRPHYHCSICNKGYRCYWDGNDIDGVGIDVCNKCADEIEAI